MGGALGRGIRSNLWMCFKDIAEWRTTLLCELLLRYFELEVGLSVTMTPHGLYRRLTCGSNMKIWN